MPLNDRDQELITWAKTTSTEIPAAADAQAATTKQNLYELALRLEDHAKAADDAAAAVGNTQDRLSAITLASGDVAKAQDILNFLSPTPEQDAVDGTADGEVSA